MGVSGHDAPREHSRLPTTLGRLLIVTGEVRPLAALCKNLSRRGYEAVGYPSAREALEALRARMFDMLLTDMRLPDMSGIALVGEALRIDPQMIPLVMTEPRTLSVAINAIPMGVYGYVLKPLQLRALVLKVSRAMEVRRLRVENMELRETVAMYQLSRAMPSHLDMDTLLQTIADTALEQCDADEMSLMLPAHEGTKLAIAVVRGEARTDLVGRCVPIEQGIAGWVARHREPVLLYGAVQDPRFTPVRHRPDIHSAISVPLQAEGRLLGVLNLSTTHRRPFSLRQVQASILLANTASSALGAASLYEQTRRAEAQYRSLFEQALVGLYRISPDGRLIRVNPMLAQLLGYETPEELMAAVAGSEAHLFREPSHRADLGRQLEARDVVRGYAIQLSGRDSRAIRVSLSMNAIRDANGALLCYQGTVEDLAPRTQG